MDGTLDSNFPLGYCLVYSGAIDNDRMKLVDGKVLGINYIVMKLLEVLAPNKRLSGKTIYDTRSNNPMLILALLRRVNTSRIRQTEHVVSW